MSENHDSSLSKQSGRVADEVMELGRVAMAKAGDRVSTWRTKGRRALETGVKGARKAKDQFGDLVGEHPMKSLMIALGAGVVLGYALRRRS